MKSNCENVQDVYEIVQRCRVDCLTSFGKAAPRLRNSNYSEKFLQSDLIFNKFLKSSYHISSLRKIIMTLERHETQRDWPFYFNRQKFFHL